MTTLNLLLVCTILALAATDAPAQFEGIVQSSNYTMDDDGTGYRYAMTMWVRKNMVRVQVPAYGSTGASTVIYRSDRKVSWVLDEAAKTYFEVSQVQGPMPPGSGTRPSDKAATNRTGKTKKVLGYLCEQVLVKRGDVETEIWGAKGLGELAAVLNATLHDGLAYGDEEDIIGRMGLYPLLSVTRFEGRILESQEVTKIERTTLSQELFQIPAGYSKQKPVDMQ